MSDNCVGPALEQCPVCGAVGLPERIRAHDCEAFCERRAIPAPTVITATNEASNGE